MKARHCSKENLNLAYESVNTYLSTTYGTENIHKSHLEFITHAAFAHLQETQPATIKNWHRKSHPEDEHIQTLLSTVQTIVVSSQSPWKPTLAPESRVQKLFLNYIRGNIPSVQEMLKDSSLLKAVTWKNNPSLMKEARTLVGDILEELYGDIEKEEMSSEELFHTKVIIGDLLSLFPFLNPQKGEILKVPTLVGEAWQLSSYQVEPIHLTPRWLGSPLVAFGLNPEAESSAPPLLLFKGTTYPTDKGFSLSLITDINPLASVGSYAFHMGKKSIKAWLDVHTREGHPKAEIYGKSLGGAQAWRTALHFPNQIDRVMAYGAPGFSLGELNKLNGLIEKGTAPEINIFCQKNDLITYTDRVASKGVNYFQIFGNHPKRGFLAHAEMYSTHEQSSIIKIDAIKHKHPVQRFIISLLKDILSFSAFPLFILIHALQHMTKSYVRLIKRRITQPIVEPNP